MDVSHVIPTIHTWSLSFKLHSVPCKVEDQLFLPSRGFGCMCSVACSCFQADDGIHELFLLPVIHHNKKQTSGRNVQYDEN